MSEKVEKVAVPVAEATDVTGEKQGAKCCLCCCDFRRAVIVLAIIGIVYYGVFFVLTLVGTGIGAAALAAADDDFSGAGAAMVGVGGGILAALFAVGMCFYIFQLFAALKYNMCMLATVIVFDLIGLGYNIYYYIAYSVDATGVAVGIIMSVIISGLFIYPTAGLIMEIKAGTMSAATYPREAYSCCCQPNV